MTNLKITGVFALLKRFLTKFPKRRIKEMLYVHASISSRNFKKENPKMSSFAVTN